MCIYIYNYICIVILILKLTLVHLFSQILIYLDLFLHIYIHIYTYVFEYTYILHAKFFCKEKKKSKGRKKWRINQWEENANWPSAIASCGTSVFVLTTEECVSTSLLSWLSIKQLQIVVLVIWICDELLLLLIRVYKTMCANHGDLTFT